MPLLYDYLIRIISLNKKRQKCTIDNSTFDICFLSYDFKISGLTTVFLSVLNGFAFSFIYFIVCVYFRDFKVKLFEELLIEIMFFYDLCFWKNVFSID